MIETITAFVISVISKIGYAGLAFLMMLESMIFPVPSEAVMPFAGYLVAQGKFDFWIAALASAVGSIIGSLISYYLGLFLGRPAILKIGKYILLNEGELAWTEGWFRRKGEITIFISRFIPVVRHLISIPAGLGKMNLKRFVLYTFAGAFLWNSFLLYLGYRLREGWQLIQTYSKEIDIMLVILIACFILYYLIRKIRKKRRIMDKQKRIKNTGQSETA